MDKQNTQDILFGLHVPSALGIPEGAPVFTGCGKTRRAVILSPHFGRRTPVFEFSSLNILSILSIHVNKGNIC